MEVYFVRHGESEYNVKHLVNFTSSVVVNLTEKGKKQVKAAAEKLAGKKIDLIFSSEFMRTQETAVILATRLGVKIKLDRRLNEIRVGEEGKSNVFYRALLKKLIDDSSFRDEGGESYDDVKKRLMDFKKSLAKMEYKRIVVVTHEMICLVAREVFGGAGTAETLAKPVENAEILKFVV